MKKILLLIVVPLIMSARHCQRTESEIEQIKKGNLALPPSQQPTPLFAFGQNIIDSCDAVPLMDLRTLIGKDLNLASFTPTVLYGIKDNVSMYISFPVDRFEQNCQVAKGFDDILVQVEYAPLNKNYAESNDQITLVSYFTFPTGCAGTTPPTGLGAPSFFFGSTQSHTEIKWYCFASEGILATTSHHGTKFGNNYLYQAGFGYNFFEGSGWLFTGMIEILGTYAQRNKICGVTDCNSGGNTIFLGPSFWIANEHLVIDIGIIAAVSKHLFGIQNRQYCIPAAEIRWKF